MTIIRTEMPWQWSLCRYERNILHPPKRGLGVSKDGFGFTQIELGLSNKKYTNIILAHEIAHVLFAHETNATDEGILLVRQELRAFRLAKSFCKSKYFLDYFARQCIYGHMKNSTPRLWVRITENHFNPRKRLKIIPLNKEIKMGDKNE